MMYPIYQSTTVNPAFEAFFDNAEALANFCNAALSPQKGKELVSVKYEACNMEKMLRGNPLDFFFSIEATMQDGSEIRIALHKKVFFSVYDEQVLNKKVTWINPYKTMYGPEELFTSYHADYDYVIWLAYVEGDEFRRDAREVGDDFWEKRGRPSRKASCTQYICYDINGFNKNMSELESDEDRWLFLLKNIPCSDACYSFGKPVFDEALGRVMSAKLTLEFACRQQEEMFCQMEYLDQLKAARKSGRAEGIADSAYRIILSELRIPLSTERSELPLFVHHLVAAYMLDKNIDPFYVARCTEIFEQDVKVLKEQMSSLRKQG